MQEVTYFVATTLDGCIARPDDSFDVFVNEGDHVADYIAALRSGFDTVLMGRRTYEMGTKVDVHDPYPWLKTFVYSKTIGDSQAANVTIVRDDPVAHVRSLKEKDGRGIYLCGGGVLAGLLLENDVVDEVIVKLNPLIVGQGLPVVSGMKSAKRLTLVDTKIYASDALTIRYRVQKGS